MEQEQSREKNSKQNVVKHKAAEITASISHLIWEKKDSRKVFGTRIFSLQEDTRRSPRGRESTFISVHAPNWVTVIPELDSSANNQLLIVRQFRHGTERVGLEFPAGVIDPGETPRQAAERELREETGYEAGELIQIGQVSPNPAFMANTTYTFVARNLRRVSSTLDLDDDELLDVCTKDFNTLSCEIGLPPFDSAITVQAWFFYLRERKK